MSIDKINDYRRRAHARRNRAIQELGATPSTPQILPGAELLAIFSGAARKVFVEDTQRTDRSIPNGLICVIDEDGNAYHLSRNDLRYLSRNPLTDLEWNSTQLSPAA